ncbi:MAG: Abortive infection protein [Actinomycetia bacterium]|nr:Abortive infection protein [Actinomycetes bacterium]
MKHAVHRWRCAPPAARPSSLMDPVQAPRESEPALHHRRQVVAVASLVGAGLLSRSLSTEHGSPQFYTLSLGVAGVWITGGLRSGLVTPSRMRNHDHVLRRPVITPVLIGVGAFAGFYLCALAARHIPVLNRSISAVLQYANYGSGPLVLLTALANGAAEEVFFRGALYTAIGHHHPVAVSAAVYSLTTAATRNPALVLASTVMGTLFGLERRVTGGVQAPILTHLTWSTLMLRFLPPLFDNRQEPKPPRTRHRLVIPL